MSDLGHLRLNGLMAQTGFENPVDLSARHPGDGRHNGDMNGHSKAPQNSYDARVGDPQRGGYGHPVVTSGVTVGIPNQALGKSNALYVLIDFSGSLILIVGVLINLYPGISFSGASVHF